MIHIMFSCPPYTSKALPKEYRGAAEALFPEGKGPSLETAKAFSAILGIGEDYKQQLNAYTSGQSGGDLLNRFQNNLDLLIQKTWVEKTDEARKNELLDRVPPFISLIESEDYPGALDEFGVILEGLAFLFFGSQSQKDDFAEYVLRIDDQMGLFWWYGGQINGARKAPWVKNVDRSALYALLLLGICYLTNF